MILLIPCLLFIAMTCMMVGHRRKKKRIFLQLMSEYGPVTESTPIQDEASRSQITSLCLLSICTIILLFLYPSPGVMLLLAGLFIIIFSSSFTTPDRSDGEIHRALPLFLEQLSMALRCGYDLQSAMRVIIELRVLHDDPCAQMFQRVQRAVADGASFDEALSLVEDGSDNGSLQYFCRYLRHSFKEGGALSESLQELSESVQQRFEDDQEAWIATLPVKATMPLLLLFLGLLLLFLTPPLLQVLSLLEKVS